MSDKTRRRPGNTGGMMNQTMQSFFLIQPAGRGMFHGYLSPPFLLAYPAITPYATAENFGGGVGNNDDDDGCDGSTLEENDEQRRMA
nr:hypothetical protein CFP56_44384 [Quercus suber]